MNENIKHLNMETYSEMKSATFLELYLTLTKHCILANQCRLK